MIRAGQWRFGSPLHVGLCQVVMAQAIVGMTAQLVEGRIAGITVGQHVEVCQGLLELAQADLDLARR